MKSKADNIFYDEEKSELQLRSGDTVLSATIIKSSNSEEPKEEPKIVTFADGTDEEISAMLEAHYAGDINIGDFWSVGDMRTIHLNAMAATGVDESHVAQDQEFVIIGIEHDDLETPINGKTKAAITVQQLHILSDNKTSGELGCMGSNGTIATSWIVCPRRTWCNNVFVNALPSTIQSLVKEVGKLNYNQNDSTVLKVEYDRAFLLSETEVLGKCICSAGSDEGYQYEYYKNLTPPIQKYIGNATVQGSAKSWWLRSHKTTSSGNNASFCYITTAGYGGQALASFYTAGLCVALCM